MPTDDARPLVNCIMLITWPKRRAMIQEAVASFACQDHAPRTLTLVNDGELCRLSAAFRAAFDARLVQLPHKTSVGDKRNAGVAAVPDADYSASFDDDDFSLPHRLSANLAAMRNAKACWLSASRKYVAIGTLDKIVGFECGRCYGAGMVSKRVTDELKWPGLDWLEDQRLFEAVRAHADLGSGMVEGGELAYVHRRHADNVSAPHRKDLWQGVMPLQLAGAEAVAAPESLWQILQAYAGVVFVEDLVHDCVFPAAVGAAAEEAVRSWQEIVRDEDVGL